MTASGDETLVYDIVLEAREISTFLRGMSRETFLEDRVMQNAIVRLLIVIGEAAHRISDGFRQAHPDIPWKAMAGMRHRLVHDYRRIRTDIVWNAATEEIPRLLPALEAIAPDPEAV